MNYRQVINDADTHIIRAISEIEKVEDFAEQTEGDLDYKDLCSLRKEQAQSLITKLENIQEELNEMIGEQ